MTSTSSPLYYVPKTGLLTLTSGERVVVVRGVRTLDDNVVSDLAATRYGIKPEHEMTAAERASEGLEPPLPDYVEPVPAEEPQPPYVAPGAAGTAPPTDPSNSDAQGSDTATPSSVAAAKPTVGPATKS